MGLPAFLEQRLRDDGVVPTLLVVCAGYEGGSWRHVEFARHLIVDCLLDFVMAFGEKEAITSATAGRQLVEAAKVIYQTEKYGSRGEFGELLLHVIIQQFYGTVPAISKLYLKSGINETVKGFDAVHVTVNGDDLELWLGEVKFYKAANSAISDVVPEIAYHVGEKYLRNEFILIKNKLDDKWPHDKKLRELIAPQKSLDQIFKRIHVPVLVTYESAVIQGHTSLDDPFLRSLEAEVRGHWSTFAGNSLPPNVVLHFILVPLGDKKALVDLLHEKLKVLQAL